MGTYFFLSAAAMLAGFLVDCLIGDPYWIPHPVCAIGKWISFFEKRLRARFPVTERGELIARTDMATPPLFQREFLR